MARARTRATRGASVRIENRVWVAIVVVMFASIPFVDVDMNIIQFGESRSQQCQVKVPKPGETGWGQSFTTLNGQSARLPVWWAFIHTLSRALTGASVAAIPCGVDLRQMRMEIDATRIDDPCWPRRFPTSAMTATARRAPNCSCGAQNSPKPNNMT